MTWLVALGLCLSARAAFAQQGPQSWPLAETFEWAQGYSVRGRDDDPDLVRVGAFASPEAALAAGARILRSMSIDLDDDGVEERVFQVAPRDDPSPQNSYPGVVLLRRGRDGWRARVLRRLIERAPGQPCNGWCVDWTALAWDRVRVGDRWRLVLFHTLEAEVPRRSGDGRESRSFDLALRVRLVDGEPHADAFCARGDGQDGDRRWRVLTPECRCVRDTSRDSDPENWPRCAPSACGNALRGDIGPSSYWSRGEGRPPAWCSAFAASLRRSATRRP